LVLFLASGCSEYEPLGPVVDTTPTPVATPTPKPELPPLTGAPIRILLKSQGKTPVVEPGPDDDTVWVGDRLYRGDARETADGVILTAPFEAYIAGVVGAEMPLKWPANALKVQAICARTYALYQIRQRQVANATRGWEVDDSTAYQVFHGTYQKRGDKARPPEAADAATAAFTTAGRYLALAGSSEPIPAFFFSTCGGGTGTAEGVFEVPPGKPFLGADCRACSASSRYRWEKVVNWGLIEQAVGITGAFTLKANSESTYGWVTSLSIEHTAGTLTISGHQLRMALMKLGGSATIDSHKFKATVVPLGVRFAGGGWGHGVGMCQWGVKGLVEEGFTVEAILERYYPGTRQLKLPE
jgi:stage II sporulation protein D